MPTLKHKGRNRPANANQNSRKDRAKNAEQKAWNKLGLNNQMEEAFKLAEKGLKKLENKKEEKD